MRRVLMIIGIASLSLLIASSSAFARDGGIVIYTVGGRTNLQLGGGFCATGLVHPDELRDYFEAGGGVKGVIQYDVDPNFSLDFDLYLTSLPCTLYSPYITYESFDLAAITMAGKFKLITYSDVYIPINPYLKGGLGLYYMSTDFPLSEYPEGLNEADLGINLGGGIEYALGSLLTLDGSLTYHQIFAEKETFSLIDFYLGVLYRL